MVTRRELGVGALGAAMLAGAPRAARATSAAGRTRRITLRSANVPGDVNVTLYTPASATRAPGPIPLMLILHGGNGSDLDLLRFLPALEEAFERRGVAPMHIAMPSARRSLYMDFKDGSQRWETFVVTDLLDRLRAELRTPADRRHTFIGGVSMGGLGCLRLAFKHPDLFGAVAALEPAIEPVLSWRDAGPRVKFWRGDQVLAPIFGNPVDLEFWAANNPATIASQAPARLLDLPIYLDVGDQDMLYLTHGTEFLHRVLFDAGVGHEYRLVRGADHVGPSLVPRMIDALDFTGRQISPPDWINEAVVKARASFAASKQAVGLGQEIVDPRRIHGQY